MFCTKCGNELKGEEMFCPKCGQQVEYKEEEKEEEKKDVEEKKTYGSSEEFFKEKLEEIKEKNDSAYKYHLAPDIPEKILVNASNKIAGGINTSKILCVYDTTIMSSGKEGIVFTGSHVYIKSTFNSMKDIDLENLTDIENVEEVHTDENGKETKTKYLRISFENQEDMKIQPYEISGDGYEVIFNLLTEFLDSVDEVEEQSQRYSSLSELGDEIIYDYLSIVCAYLRSDDGIIDSQEYKEFISLMSRIKVSKQLSDRLRENRLNIDNEEVDFVGYVGKLKEDLKKEKRDTCALYQSLFKDLLLMRKGNINEWKNDPSLCELKELLNIKENQVEVFIKSIELDEKMITERLEDDQIKEFTKELIAVAGGAGVTLAALAITGGISSGICGGLLTLGLLPGGGMLLGLAAIGGLSYGAYKGIKYFSGTSELEKSGIRISALQEAISNNKRAVTYIIEDINYLTEKVSELFDKIHNQESNINDELFSELSDYLNFATNVGKSGTLFEENSQRDEYEVHIAKLPLDLPYDKFIELANQNVNGEVIKDYILQIYKETEIVTSTTTDGNETENPDNVIVKTVYRRAEELPYETAAQAYNYLQSIGFYEVKDATLAQGKALAKKGIGALKGLLR